MNYPIEFIEWYSGMTRDKIESAYQRYLRENNLPIQKNQTDYEGLNGNNTDYFKHE